MPKMPARTHTDAQVAAIAASIKEWGWTTPALVGEDGMVEGGTPWGLPRLQPERQGPDRGLGLVGAAHTRRARVDASRVGRGGRLRSCGIHAGHRAGAVCGTRRRVGRHRQAAVITQPSSLFETERSGHTPALNPHRPTPLPAQTPPAVSSLEAFRTPASENLITSVNGRRPKTLNILSGSR